MPKVKLLGICGSPRPQGNSRYLLKQAVEEALSIGSDYLEAEIYSIAKKEFAPCDSCSRCATLGECWIKDDFQELRDKWVAADAIIYSVPVYHMGVPGQLKCFIDRLGNSLWSYYGGVCKSLRVIGVIAQGSHIFAGQEHTIAQLINHSLIMGCVPISGDSWGSYTGVGGWTFDSSRKDAISKLYNEGDFCAQVAVEAACSLGRRVIQLALLIKTGAEANREMLKADGGYGQLLARLSPLTTSSHEGLHGNEQNSG